MIIGDVVLIHYDLSEPRQNWRLERIQRVIYGKDGKARDAELLTVSKQMKNTISYRQLQKLIPFEICKCKDLPYIINKKALVDSRTDNKCKRHDKPYSDNSRPRRQAAIDGQYLRKLRQRYL